MDGLDGEAHRGEETGGMIAAGEGVSIAYRRRIGKPGLAGVVFMGGFRSDMTGTKATALDRFCAARGQSYLRFDYRGHGASGGARASRQPQGFGQLAVSDHAASWDFLHHRVYGIPIHRIDSLNKRV